VLVLASCDFIVHPRMESLAPVFLEPPPLPASAEISSDHAGERSIVNSALIQICVDHREYPGMSIMRTAGNGSKGAMLDV
jgi:hypothetical protein